MKVLTETLLMVFIGLVSMRSGRFSQRRNSRLMNWNQLTSDMKAVPMPRGLSSDQSASKSTEDISRQLQELNLIRGSKNIDQISDKDKQEPAAKTSSNNDDNDDDASDNDVVSDKDKEVCVQKVMQVPHTVWEDKVVCHHKFSEKCHTTFMTDYVPTQEQKCHTSYNKRCRISYKPSVSTEKIEVCRDSLEKQCSNDTVGETVCRVVYQTQCNTRYNEMTMEEDQPVCEMVTQTKCNPTTTQSSVDESLIPNFVQEEKEECVEWPVKQCKLEKKTVKKVKPETWCEKMSQNVCAPSNCIIAVGEKKCQEESRNVLVSTPSEECDLEPVEDCRMETVLVPRLVERPKCIKVPREVCVNQRVNPKKLFKPVIKEWCYKPSQVKFDPATRNIRQFIKHSLF